MDNNQKNGFRYNYPSKDRYNFKLTNPLARQKLRSMGMTQTGINALLVGKPPTNPNDWKIVQRLIVTATQNVAATGGK